VSALYYATTEAAAAFDLLLLGTAQILDGLAFEVNCLDSPLLALFLSCLPFSPGGHHTHLAFLA